MTRRLYFLSNLFIVSLVSLQSWGQVQRGLEAGIQHERLEDRFYFQYNHTSRRNWTFTGGVSVWMNSLTQPKWSPGSQIGNSPLDIGEALGARIGVRKSFQFERFQLYGFYMLQFTQGRYYYPKFDTDGVFTGISSNKIAQFSETLGAGITFPLNEHFSLNGELGFKPLALIGNPGILRWHSSVGVVYRLPEKKK